MLEEFSFKDSTRVRASWAPAGVFTQRYSHTGEPEIRTMTATVAKFSVSIHSGEALDHLDTSATLPERWTRVSDPCARMQT
ncbi:hypothetical protein [Pseudarthrobacter sp. PvP090]|uniref:hypothetical protein n=1 Tax=Pseudarthrobacter sp. PvP090 TaxID=3156393 RepID=UPI003395C87E